MKKVISVILAMAMCFVLVGCGGDNKQAYDTSTCRDIIIGDLVFKIQNEAKEDLYSREESDLIEVDVYDLYTYIEYSDDNSPMYKIEIQTATGESAKNLYNDAVSMYSDIGAYYEDFNAKYPEYAVEVPEYSTVVEELPSINGVEYQIGSCWTVDTEGTTNRLHILSCIIDDVYYYISYTGTETTYDQAFWNGFISNIRKL